jgi:GNAT superfamily N-acetyltransferase
VADFIFKGQSDLKLLFINQEKISAEIKYEGDEGNKFPHVYGKLNLDAVISVHPFSETVSGFSLPQPFVKVGDTLIRPGFPGDESELASVHIHAWQQSYKGIIPENFLSARPLSYRSRFLWWKSVVEGKTPTTVFVAESAQHGIVGFNAVEPSRDNSFSEYGEVAAIYCLNEYKKKGIGTALFAAGQDCLRQKGFKNSYLWVLKENPTVEFYRRMGGEILNKEKTVELGKPLIEIAFGWKL